MLRCRFLKYVATVIVGGLAAVAIHAFAAETLTLTAPITKASQTAWKVDWVKFDVTNKVVTISIVATDGSDAKQIVYGATPGPVSGQTGTSILSTVNTCNCTVNSMVKRTLNLLAQDNFIT